MCLNLWITLTPPTPRHLLENLLSAKKLFFQAAPTIFCPARVCLDGAGVWQPWGHSTDGPEAKQARRANPSISWAATGSVTQRRPTFPCGCPGKAPVQSLLRQNEESGISHQARRSSSSGCGFQILGKCLEFWFSWKNIAFSARPLKVQGVHHGGSDLPPRKFCLWLWWKCDGSEARNAIQRLDSLQPGDS